MSNRPKLLIVGGFPPQNCSIFGGVVTSCKALLDSLLDSSLSVPPYTIVGGVPAKVIRFLWDVESILRHGAILYPAEQRLERAALERWQKEILDGHDRTP
jgi:hypothetical protein